MRSKLQYEADGLLSIRRGAYLEARVLQEDAQDLPNTNIILSHENPGPISGSMHNFTLHDTTCILGQQGDRKGRPYIVLKTAWQKITRWLYAVAPMGIAPQRQ